MEELSIKIKVANRVYPLTIQPEEEERVRKAADKINETISEYKKMYAAKDFQDLLAMVVLELATDNLEIKNKGIVVNTSMEDDLIKMDELISQQL
ncbi:MAG TPA: cell division protein ZapA [Vicingaceae bacterium]|jgi:cell division protein ZapA|nr:cell division protein ZapA [Vicingaceae bacterium]